MAFSSGLAFGFVVMTGNPPSYKIAVRQQEASRQDAGHRKRLGIVLCWNGMRIDPKSMIGRCPALVVRKTLRQLRIWDRWNVTELEAAAGLAPGTGKVLVKALQAEGLIESCARGVWSVTQAGCTYSVATAAKAVTRVTAERALAQFLDRVEQVNCDPYFLGKVVRVVLFGSMFKAEVMRVSDVDLAVELATKETDGERAREQNDRRAEELVEKGKQFRNTIEVALCWYFETWHFLKGGSRVLALADYKTEKPFVLAVPHCMLLGDDELLSAADSAKAKSEPAARRRRPRDCPF
ncbi:MAG TPA: nucleotidyltransferase domain-containing protein [Candidatus Acidoferrales bacterium]|nr:nucleotidyltransferase domain-containing protein [Candidatus Acidoferrales bacterium]